MLNDALSEEINRKQKCFLQPKTKLGKLKIICSGRLLFHFFVSFTKAKFLSFSFIYLSPAIFFYFSLHLLARKKLVVTSPVGFVNLINFYKISYQSQHFCCKSISSKHTFKAINLHSLPMRPLIPPDQKPLFVRVLQIPFTSHFIIKLIFLAV